MLKNPLEKAQIQTVILISIKIYLRFPFILTFLVTVLKTNKPTNEGYITALVKVRHLLS